jgi:hypothetical protein
MPNPHYNSEYDHSSYISNGLTDGGSSFQGSDTVASFRSRGSVPLPNTKASNGRSQLSNSLFMSSQAESNATSTMQYDDLSSDDWSGSNVIVYRDEDGNDQRVDNQSSPNGTLSSLNERQERGFVTPPVSADDRHNQRQFEKTTQPLKKTRSNRIWVAFLITLVVLAILAVIGFLFFPRGPSVVDLTAAFARPMVPPYPFKISTKELTLSLTMDVSLYSANYYKLNLNQVDLSVSPPIF